MTHSSNNPYGSSGSIPGPRQPADNQTPPASTPKTYIGEIPATILAVVLGLLGVLSFFGAIGLLLDIIAASIPTATWLYVSAVAWEYNSSKVAKDGLTLGELFMVLLGPINTLFRVMKIRKLQSRLNNANTQASARDTKDNTLLGEKTATYLGYALYVVLAFAVWQAISNGLSVIWLIIGLLVCVYVLGMAIAYIGLDVRKDGLDSSEVKLLAWWPGLIGKSVDELRASVNTTSRR